MRFVYATADGYAKVLDKPKYDKKGSNLIRQFCFSIDRKFKDKNLLDDLIYKTKKGVEDTAKLVAEFMAHESEAEKRI